MDQRIEPLVCGDFRRYGSGFRDESARSGLTRMVEHRNAPPKFHRASGRIRSGALQIPFRSCSLYFRRQRAKKAVGKVDKTGVCLRIFGRTQAGEGAGQLRRALFRRNRLLLNLL